MQKFFSRKYGKINVLSSVLDSINKSNTNRDKLMIHTANGLYVGKLRSPLENSENLNIEENDDILTCYNKLYLSYMEKYINSDEAKTNIEVPENPITVDLEDVDIITSMKTIHLPFVSIFVDQIIGISIGHFD